MKVISKIKDYRINCYNIVVETTYGEYLKFARDIINNNELQRKRVRSSKTIYSLLKEDIKRGCIIPPIVLASTSMYGVIDTLSEDEIAEFISTNPKDLLILDGLQRTYTILDVEEELNMEQQVSTFHEMKLRIEIYVGINKFGILYRMLTLNTGQTPMSTRHQIEMLYKDLLNNDIQGVKLVLEKDELSANSQNEINFKDIIEGFNSYLKRDELPIDRIDILENIKTLEKLSLENSEEDTFKEFTNTYLSVMNSLYTKSNKYEITIEDLKEYDISNNPFAKTAIKVFNKSQAITGFGAAVGKLKDFGLINSLGEIGEMVENVDTQLEERQDWLIELVAKLDKIKITSKKIGNSQRMYFQYFFRELFNKDGDSYLNLERAVENGYKKYLSQV